MDKFSTHQDIVDLKGFFTEVQQIRSNPLANALVGKFKSLALVCFDKPPLHTHLALEKACQNLGLAVVPVFLFQEKWRQNYSTQDIVWQANHFCDIVAVYSEAKLKDLTRDYEDSFLQYFETYSTIPVLNLGSQVANPLEGLSTLFSIHDIRKKQKNKLVLSWIPSLRPKSQAKINTLLALAQKYDMSLTLTHPPNYRPATEFSEGIKSQYSQAAALQDTDFVCALPWSSFRHYGKNPIPALDWSISKDKIGEAKLFAAISTNNKTNFSADVLEANKKNILQQNQNILFVVQAVLKRLIGTT